MSDKVLVVGGAGFIGSNVCAHLVSEGYETVSLDLSACPISGVRSVIGDFFDTDLLVRLVSEVSVVVHALGILNPGNSLHRYMFGYERELAQTARLFEVAAKVDARVVYISSGGTVYGRHTCSPIKEDTPCEPINHYGALKLCSETAMRVFSEESGVPMIAARVANPYGPGQDSSRGVGFIDAAIRAALSRKILQIWGDGTTVRDYIYIDDAAGMISALCGYEGTHRIFNISSGKGTSQLDILRTLESIGLQPAVEMSESRSIDLKNCVLDNSLIKGFYRKPVLSVGEGIAKYVGHFNNHLIRKDAAN